MIADEHRSKVYLPGLRVRATFLIDGFVAGGWEVETKKGQTTMQLEPFVSLTKAERDELAAEAEKLARFIQPDAKAYIVAFVES